VILEFMVGGLQANDRAKSNPGCLNRLAGVALGLATDNERAASGSDGDLFQRVQVVTQPPPLHFPTTAL